MAAFFFLPLWAALVAAQAPDPPASEPLVTQPPASTEPAPTPEPTDDPQRIRIYETLEVVERSDELVGIARAASEGTTGKKALEQRPLLRTGELVETIPGMIATQHSGTGKANQYFLRGMNLDHGTDFSVRVGGIPVNLPSHGHGQGYADLSFVIPELVERVRFSKGTYLAEYGDFSAAGAAEIDFVRRLERALVELSAGSHGYGRALFANTFALGGGDLTAAVEGQRDDGPWQREEDGRRLNTFVRYARGDSARGFSLTATGYDGSWLATDQIPQRAVESGLIDRFGTIDDGPRGDSSRTSLAYEGHRGGDRSYTSWYGFAAAYDLALFSNFTYFLDDPERGDQFEQRDDRRLFGLGVRHHRQSAKTLGGRPLEWTVGLDLRYDDIENGLFRTAELERVSTTRRDQIGLLGGGPWGEVELHLHRRVRATAGLRVDRYDADVESDLGVNSGRAGDTLVAPKLQLAFGPWARTELYTSYGHGFHSNDARGATIRVDPSTGAPAQRVDPLVRARGLELGLRSHARRGLHTTLALFELRLDSELVFAGDGGTTEASRPSRRRGIEWTNVWQANPWLSFDFDLAFTDAEFADHDPAGREIPGALERVLAAGATIDRAPWQASVRVRGLSGYPLIEDGSVRAG